MATPTSSFSMVVLPSKNPDAPPRMPDSPRKPSAFMAIPPFFSSKPGWQADADYGVLMIFKRNGLPGSERETDIDDVRLSAGMEKHVPVFCYQKLAFRAQPIRAET